MSVIAKAEALAKEIDAAAQQMVDENMTAIEMGLVDGDQIWLETAQSMLIGKPPAVRQLVMKTLGF